MLPKCIILGFFFFAFPILGKTQIAPQSQNQTLTIKLQWSKRSLGLVDQEKISQLWQATCVTWKKLILADQKELAYFSKVNCLPPVFGRKKVETDEGWNLVIFERNGNLNIKLYYQLGEKQKEKKIYFYDEYLSEVMAYLFYINDSRFGHLMISILRDHLPFLGRVQLKDGKNFEIETKDTPNLFGKDLLLYDLYLLEENQVFVPKIYGTAKLLKNEGSIVTYKMFDLTGIGENRELWLHNAQGRNSNEKIHDKEWQSLEESADGPFPERISKYLYHTALSSFIGMRYSVPLGLGDSIVNRASQFAVIGEVRGGFFSGLRISAEMTPKVEDLDLNNQISSFAWDRVGLGWALNLDLSTWSEGLISRMTLTPRLSLLNLKMQIPYREPTGEYKTALFEVEKTPDFNFELGFEFDHDLAFVRVWGQFSNSFLETASQLDQTTTSTNSRKVGADLYVDAFDIGDYSLAIGFFGNIEQLNLEKESAENEANAENVLVKDLSFNMVFGGIGAFLSW